MTRDDIIRMAREAGWPNHMVAPIIMSKLAEFAKVVAAAEREACAKVCDDQGQGRFALEHYAALTYAGATHDCANRIRARGQQ